MVQRAAAAARTIAAILLAVVNLQTVTAQDGAPSTSILINIEQPLSAGRSYEITCTAVGWETPPNITWWIGVQQLHNTTQQQVSEDGSETVSTLLLTPTPYDNDRTLACRAENEDVFEDDYVQLNVYFAPILHHRLPAEKEFEEGFSVYFTCNISANPRTYIDSWLFQGRPFQHNPCNGVHWLHEGNSALEMIKREEAGDYTCMAANVEGETTSEPLPLRVIYKPDCRGPREQVYTVPPHETVSFLCDVDALPPVEGFSWVFSSTTASGSNRTEWRGGLPQRNHTPVADEDYGAFYCWARNALGEQKKPCVFHIVPPGPPEAPINCSMTNWAESVEVKCADRYDGGHRQQFFLEAFDAASGKLLYNQTDSDGAFLVEELSPRQPLHLRVTAYSVRGRSETVTLATTTLAHGIVEDEEREESSNCSVLNRTSQSLMMVCLGGFDNTPTQSFLAELFDSTASRLFTRTAQKHQIVMVNGMATKQQRRMRMLADSFNGQIAAVMMDFPSSQTKDLTIQDPHSTRILLSEPWMVARKSVEVTCRSVGSEPPAYITWWLDNQRLFDTSEQVADDGSVTLSTVRFTPSRLDDRAMLTCRAENPYVSSSAQEHSVSLVVCYPPKVSLYLERPMRTDDIREGDNVNLKCQAMSNPPAWRVRWLFQGRLLQEIYSNDTLNETLTLSLGPVNRTQAGDYSCIVSNAMGDTESSPVRLSIKYKPLCRSQQPVVYSLPKGEEVLLECEVDAAPCADGYRWMFNSSLEAQGATMSFLEWARGGYRRLHKPVNDMDYGTFYCWAYNAMGLQEEPCVFHVAPPGRPSAPTDCYVLNKTSESFAVQCPASTDGGRRQSYRLEVFDVNTGHIVYNATQWSPYFLVSNLWPKRPITLRVAVVSVRGRSEWVRLNTFTLPQPPPTPIDFSVTQKKGTRLRNPHPNCSRVIHKRPCLPNNVPRL